MKSIEFNVLDVFTGRPFHGNQLAVFYDPKGQLSTKSMQALTRELNFAESAFVQAQNTDGSWQVRIFTPEKEVPFAGHPSLGVAFDLRRRATSPPDTVWLDLKAGRIPVTFRGETGYMQQIQPRRGRFYLPEELGPCIGLEPGDFLPLPIQEISTGLPYFIVHLRSREALAKVAPQAGLYAEFLKKYHLHVSNHPEEQSTALYFVTPDTADPLVHYRSRMFSLERGHIVEDAATGSANGCFLAYLLEHQAGKINVTVNQGVEMGRSSTLYLEGQREDGKFELLVGGKCAPMASGIWTVDQP